VSAVRIDATLDAGDHPAAAVAATVAAQEAAGFAATWAAEAAHDPFLPLALGAGATERIELGTGIAVALSRSPMHLAYLGHDLQVLSGGRFLLGLGSQVKAHVERRFGAPFDQPAARMRELVAALRTIWASWDDESPLDFRGDFYRHTLMPPLFRPAPSPFGPPAVFVAGVGTRMTAVAGEVADGFCAHSFTTTRYLSEVTRPALDRGRAAAGRTDPVAVYLPLLLVTGDDEESMATARHAVKQSIAVYASTPTYRPVLDVHGWGDIQAELGGLVRQGRWQDLAAVVDDEMLEAFALVAEPDHVPACLDERYGGLVDRVSFSTPYDLTPTVASALTPRGAGRVR
jgi:probable F420-dependent oxidoreductase